MASNLHVLIIGAGTAGLMLGVLLERADISYEIFEKTKELRPLGSGIALGALSTLFEQLGMWEELKAMSKPFGALRLRNEDLSEIGAFRTAGDGVFDVKEVYGDYSIVVSRPDLIKLLLSRIPPSKIHYNKRVLKTKQGEDHVQITCSDDSVYKGSILVGADGAYSSVRQNMYQELEKLGQLPKVDAKPMRFDYDCVVGVTQPLDPEKFPVVLEEFCEFEIVLGKDIPFAWWFMPLEGRRIGWMIVQDERGTGEQKNFRYSEWGPEAAETLCKQVAHLPSPYGKHTLGDIIGETAKDRITKVMLEEKCFQTWYHGRTVLLGDACHKMLPFGGQGACCAIQGALELTNLLYDMESTSQQGITKVFEQYYKTRYDVGRTSVNLSSQMGSLMHTQGFLGDCMRRIALHYTPQWIIRKASDRYNVVPPQLRFLPYVELRGTFKREHAKHSKKWLAAQAAMAL
ncbi:hypothetical protein EMPS_07083 [Entomortierella parvispora]|uniref:FAD-binding domain-containing protein n=1 Tax=Entomortierella parvispora TaxID=205924 RepID=A0A9P3LYC3_9FUNG|nr:hypothetical protein EMPS_07083 [Entomortierella parvispora]